MATLATKANSFLDAPEATQPDPPRIEATQPAVESNVIATLHSGWLRRIGVPLLFWAVAFLSAALATGVGDRELARWAALGPGVIGLLSGLTLWRRRAVIRQTGVEVTSFWGTRRIQYADVKSFTFDARSYRLYLPIPLGRVAELSLKGKRGGATFHAGFAGFDKYAPFIIDRVVEASVQRMRASIDRGESVKFGRRIRVDRTHLRLRRWFRYRAIPLDDIAIEVADGDFRISVTSTQKRLAIFPLKRTPNLLVLPQLIEELADTRERPHPITLQNALQWDARGT